MMLRNDNKVFIGGAAFLAAVTISLIPSIILAYLPDGARGITSQIIRYFIQASYVLIIWLLARKTSTKISYLAEKPKASSCILGAGVAVAAFAVFYLAAFLVPVSLKGMGYHFSTYQPSVAELVLGIVRSLLFAPICEEVLFRGGVLSATNSLFSGKKYGDIWSILSCGVLFMIMHMNPEQTIYQFSLGCVLAMLALATRSVVPSIIAHFTSNCTAVALSFGGGAVIESGLQVFFDALPALYIIVAVVVALGALVGFYFLLKLYQKKSDAKGVVMTDKTEVEEVEVVNPQRKVYGITFLVIGLVLSVLIFIVQLSAGITG